MRRLLICRTYNLMKVSRQTAHLTKITTIVRRRCPMLIKRPPFSTLLPCILSSSANLGPACPPPRKRPLKQSLSIHEGSRKPNISSTTLMKRLKKNQLGAKGSERQYTRKKMIGMIKAKLKPRETMLRTLQTY